MGPDWNIKEAINRNGVAGSQMFLHIHNDHQMLAKQNADGDGDGNKTDIWNNVVYACITTSTAMMTSPPLQRP